MDNSIYVVYRYEEPDFDAEVEEDMIRVMVEPVEMEIIAAYTERYRAEFHANQVGGEYSEVRLTIGEDIL